MKNDPFEVAEKYAKNRAKGDNGASHPEGIIPGPSASIVDRLIEDGRIIAVEICSNVLEAHIWLAFDEDFDPKDGQAIFYVAELPFLTTKTPEQLRDIHTMKLAFGPGSRVRE